MTRTGFVTLVGLLLAVFAGTGYALFDSFTERAPERTCAEWMELPRSGRVTLTGCLVDASESSFYDSHPEGYVERAAMTVRRPDSPGGPTHLVLITRDAHLRALVDRVERAHTYDEVERLVERFPGVFRSVRDLHGEVRRRPSSAEDQELVSLVVQMRSEAGAQHGADSMAAPETWVIEATTSSASLRAVLLSVHASAALLLALILMLQSRWSATARRLRAGQPEPTAF